MTADQMPDEKFGDRIKVLRENSKQSLQTVADAVGSSKSHVWELEQKRTKNPCLNTILAFSKHFSVSVSYLIEGFDSATPPKSQGVEAAKKLEVVKMVLKAASEDVRPAAPHWHNDFLAKAVERVEEVQRLYAQDATRQHPTPAQAQGERGKAYDALYVVFKDLCEAKLNGRPLDGWERVFVQNFHAALSHAPEVVTVDEFARGMVIAIAADLTPKEIAESLQKNYPHGLIIKRTE